MGDDSEDIYYYNPGRSEPGGRSRGVTYLKIKAMCKRFCRAFLMAILIIM